jgi:hypothetical protein
VYEHDAHRVVLHWAVFQLPEPTVEGVLLHVVAHAARPPGEAHGRAWTSLMDAAMPDWRKHAEAARAAVDAWCGAVPPPRVAVPDLTDEAGDPVGAVARHRYYLARPEASDASALWRLAYEYQDLMPAPGEALGAHRAVLLQQPWEPGRDGRPDPPDGVRFLKRGACLGCGVEGPDRVWHDEAIEDAVDHVHPGWREMPVVEQAPRDWAVARRHRAWRRQVRCLYPQGWFEAGGPLRVWRGRSLTRHTPGAAPGGGFVMVAERDVDRPGVSQLALM